MLAIAAAGCGDDESSTDNAEATDSLVVYSGRDAELVEDLYAKFEKESGVKLEVRYADTPELAATLIEEGENTPADVFYAQDAGAIGSVANEGLLAPITAKSFDDVPDRFRATDGNWTGITGRARTQIYNTDELKPDELPESVLTLTEPAWKGRVAIAPGNSSFQGFVTAMRETTGDEKTQAWLEGLKANDVKTYEGNGDIAAAVADGEVDTGLVNHYYLYELLAEKPDAPAANHFFKKRDPGAFVNASAAGVLKGGKNQANAQKFIEFLLSEGQAWFATEAAEKEYPVIASYHADLPESLPPLHDVEGPDVPLDTLGDELPSTVRMIESVGFPGT
ncbi:MAG: iron ABC transporter substrate-binding protein [Solirubrobacterales bacterium]